MIRRRRLAVTIGVLYLITFITSIPALPLKRAFLLGEATESALHVAVILEVALALACIGTAIAFYPIGRMHSSPLSLGFVASRTLEASTIFIGVIALLSVGTLRRATTPDAVGAVGASGDAVAVDALNTVGTSTLSQDSGIIEALTAVHDWAFLIGPGLLPAANALLFGTLLFRARLVPRIIPLVGIIGAPLLTLSAFATIFGIFDQVSPWAALMALPIALWEFGIGAWLIFKGFAPDTTSVREVARPAPHIV